MNFIFYVKKNNLRPRVFKVNKIDEDGVIGHINFKDEEKVKKNELIELKLNNRLLNFMMKLSTFWNYPNIRKAIQKLKYKSRQKCRIT